MKPCERLGVVPVIPVPFTPQEEIDEAALRRLVDFAVQIGVSAICLPAYGSEFYKLSDEERLRVVKVAVEQAAGQTRVFAQSNHGSARHAAVLAKKNVAAGADYISVAVPRQFSLPEQDLLRYLCKVLEAVAVPCLVQDFNPGGPTISVDFVARLKERCPNLCYLKLEEPMMAARVRAIRQATAGTVGILAGWGGLYLPELVPAGICGVLPGLALADILSRVLQLRAEGRSGDAFQLFEKILPQIVFSLQNLELFLHCEKRLLMARGLLGNAICRSPAYTPDPDTLRYVDELNERILRTARELSPPAVQA